MSRVRGIAPCGTLRIMRLYAERPGAAGRQLITDLIVVLWVYVWVRLAFALYDTVSKLAAPGRKLATAGDRMSEQFRDAVVLLK